VSPKVTDEGRTGLWKNCTPPNLGGPLTIPNGEGF
jgi:hypothetical protein